MAYSFGSLGSDGASAVNIPDPADRFSTTGLHPGDPCVIYDEHTFANFRALAWWMVKHGEAHMVTLPNMRCEVCDSDGCRVEHKGHFFDGLSCFADWLEEHKEGEWGVVQEPIEDGGWGM